MSETKHTPGPWTAIGHGGTHDGGSNKQHPCFHGKILSRKGQCIVSFSSFLGVQGKTPDEAEANAHLIAAASDLLEMCKKQNEELAYAVDLLKGDAPVEWLAVIGNAQTAIAATKGT